MSILSFSEYIKEQNSLSEDIGIRNMNRDVLRDKDELLKQVVELVGSASESGIQIQIADIITDSGKACVKVLINGVEHDFILKDENMLIKAPDGGFLDGVEGNPDKVLHILLGIKNGSLSEV